MAECFGCVNECFCKRDGYQPEDISECYKRDELCPICNMPMSCQCHCRYDGSYTPDKRDRVKVVLDHLHLLTPRQLNHIIYLEKAWNIHYSAGKYAEILDDLENNW